MNVKTKRRPAEYSTRGGLQRKEVAVDPAHKEKCVCLNCAARILHEPGPPCYTVRCPQCGSKMAKA
jgi:Zn finger protein HypA/HybF involved in hydrogenase expression